jgi:hypothetical protein
MTYVNHWEKIFQLNGSDPDPQALRQRLYVMAVASEILLTGSPELSIPPMVPHCPLLTSLRQLLKLTD